MTDELKTVSTHSTLVEAELVKGRLESAGIEAFIHAPHANALYPGVLGEVKLQVKQEDMEQALGVLEEVWEETSQWDDPVVRQREFLKDTLRKEVDFSLTDQSRGVPAPAIQKPCDPDAHRVSLLPPDQWRSCISQPDLASAISGRQSRRRYLPEPLSLAELSFLLYSTQGIRDGAHGPAALRTVPSAGARHCFETYLLIQNVSGVQGGLYRYLPLEHEMVGLGDVPDMDRRLALATFGQAFVGTGAVTFVWAAVPYRMEWRYGLSAHRVILMDAGHICQNLYLACEAIGAGTCAVAAYDQEEMDELIGVDGQDEFTVYLAPVGKVKK